ncbi:MAG: GNAT family N-acetyltransferase [Actinobacteria bacterium]|nr:GNAT family N-acetyltransferase [Actinomycetota bacterium]
MDLNLIIKDLSCEQLGKIEFKCIECSYWFDCEKTNFLKELSKVQSIRELRGFLKGKLFEESSRKDKRKKIISFKEHGGRIKAAFIGGKCVGIILAGNYYLFPRLRNFNVFPPDFESIFLGCIYVISEYRGMNVAKRLLIEIEKDLIKEKVKSIESISKRLNDDIDEEEYENSPLIPFKFLIKNGFYLKKNDPLFPLLRLDLKSIVSDFAESKILLGKMALEKEVRSHIIIKNR